MSALSIQPTYPIFTDIDGQPLEAGYIWVGTVNLDPQTNPISVYWDAALTQPAAQPIRTLGGYPANSGTPARLYVNSDYSIRVMNKNGSVVYSAPASTERFSDVVVTGVNAEDVIYDPPFTSSVSTTVENKLSEYVSVKDFGAVGDNAADDTDAFKDAIAAISAGQTLYVPPGTYKLTDTLVLSKQINLLGDGWDASKLSFTVPGAAAIEWTVNPFGSQFSGLRITSTLTKNSGTDDIGLKGRENGSNRQWVIDRCYIDGFSLFGVMLHLGWNCTIQNSEIRNCGNSTNGGGGVIMYDANGSTIGSTGHLFQNNYIAGCWNGFCSGSVVSGYFGYAWNNTYINNIYESNEYPVNFVNGGRQTLIKHYQESNNNASVLNGGVILDFVSIESFVQTFPNNTVKLDKDNTLYQGVFQTDDTDFALKPLSRTGSQVGTGPVDTPIIRGMDGKFVFGSSSYEWYGQFIANGVGYTGGTFDYTTSPAFTCIDTDSATGVDNRFGAFLAVNRDSRSPGGLPAGGRGGMMIWGNGSGNSSAAGSYVSFYTATNVAQDVEQVRIERDGNLRPARDDDQSCGTASFLWSEIFAASGSINTSDETLKQDIEDLSDAEKRVAQSIKGLIKRFRFKDAVAKKGDAARIHIGVMAQQLKAAFDAEGLDAYRYGMFCQDTWHEYDGKEVPVNENKKYVVGYMAVDGQKVAPDSDGNYPENAEWVEHEYDTEEKTRLSLRYDEVLAFVLAAI